MAGGYTERDRRVYFRVSSLTTARYISGLPVFATLFCILWSVIFDFEASTRTHCHVWNFLPSISAAIGGFTPQIYVWRICIALHCSPRLTVAIAYYNYHTSVHVGKNNELYKTLAALCSLLHICVHVNSFITFVSCATIYMGLTLYLLSWGRSGGGRVRTHKESRSLYYKKRIYLFNFLVFVMSLYLYYRHNTYCEPGVYSLYAACEYLIVLSNIGFHATAYFDFDDVSLVWIKQEDVDKVLKRE